MKIHYTLFALLFSAITAFAQTTTWTGNSNKNWHIATNWSSGLPSASQNAIIPAVVTSGNFPEIIVPTVFNFEVENWGELTIKSEVTSSGNFHNKPGSKVHNSGKFGVNGKFYNDGIFKNGCFDCDPEETGLTINPDGAFYNHSTIVNDAVLLVDNCSKIYFDSPTKLILGGDIRLKGTAYLLRGEVFFTENSGAVLFDEAEEARPSVNGKNITVQLDATGQASITAAMIDDESNSGYCTPLSLSVDVAHFTCADTGVQIVHLIGHDARGFMSTVEVEVTVLPSQACNCPTNVNPGTIGGDQFFCPTELPAPMYSVTPPSGGLNQFDYQWEKTTTDPTNGGVGEIIAGANGPDYQMPVLTQTTWFRRTVRHYGCSQFDVASEWLKVTWQNPLPTAICVPYLEVLKPANSAAVVDPMVIDNGSVAGCDGISYYALSQNTFNQISTYNVNLLVANNSGEISHCTTTIVVRNPPTTSNLVLNCQPNVTVTASSTTSTGAVATFSLNGGSTDCVLGGLTYTQTNGLPSGSTFPIGETQICYTATDPCNSSKECCFTVTVKRPVAPTYVGTVTNTPITVTLTGTTVNTSGTTTYTYTVTSQANRALSHIAFQLPTGIKAVSPNNTYVGSSGRSYQVENTTKNPFHCIKFNTVGEGIRDGRSETFSYTLPSGVAVPTTITISAKYATNVNTLVLRPVLKTTSTSNLAAPSGIMTINAYRNEFDVNVKFSSKISKRVVEYRIQRSSDNENWETIGTEFGGGEAGEINYYSFTDENPMSGMNHYRIQAQLDLGIDWETEVAKVEMMKFGEFSVFPNPADTKVFVDMSLFEGKKADVQIADQTGRVIHTITYDAAPAQPVEISLNGLNEGFYTVSISSEGIVNHRKMVVSHN